MGLLDKVKAQATAATEMAKDAAAKGQAKMNEAQAKKAADGMLRDLGAAYYATKTGRATPATDDEIATLVTTLQAHESEHGPITLAPESSRGRPHGSACRRVCDSGAPATPEGGRPGVATTASAHCTDPVARSGGGLLPVHVRCLLRRGVEQSGSSSGS